MATVGYGNHELDYDAVMKAYDDITNGNDNNDGCILISGVPLPVEVPVKDLYRIVDGINNGTAEIDYRPLNLRTYDVAPMVETKEDMDYQDLCTLEALLSYFKHDAALDEEIANLKEQSLLKEINILETAAKENNKSRDAMMIMSHINPADIPKEKWNHIMTDATYRPSILLNYLDEDVELTWPVRKIVDGQVVMVSHGLRSKNAADEGDA